MWLTYETKVIRYYDSSHYSLKRRAAKKEDSATKQKCIFEIVRKWIEKISGEEFKFVEETAVEKLPRQDNDVDCGVYLLFYADCKRNKFTINRELSREQIKNYRSRLGNVVEHQPKHGKERWPNNDWLNISAEKVPRYSYKLACQLGTAGANKEKNTQIEASLNDQLEMKKLGRDVFATQATTTSERFSAKQLSECITPKIEGACTYALLKWGTQGNTEWVQADCIVDLDGYGPRVRTLEKWILEGQGRKKSATDLDSLYRAVNPKYTIPLGKEIVDRWKIELEKKRVKEDRRGGLRREA